MNKKEYENMKKIVDSGAINITSDGIAHVNKKILRKLEEENDSLKKANSEIKELQSYNLQLALKQEKLMQKNKILNSNWNELKRGLHYFAQTSLDDYDRAIENLCVNHILSAMETIEERHNDY